MRRATQSAAALAVVALLGLSACSGSDDEPTGNGTAATDGAGSSAEPTAGGTEPTTDETEPSADGTEQVDVFDVGLGDCISEFDADRQISDVTKIPCEQEHDQEVFAVLVVPDGDFPGSDAFQAQIEKDCVPAFTAFVGTDYHSSALDIKWLEPTAESWADGDRDLVCTVFDPAGRVTGTLEGAKR